jgi:membrane protein insertase Oxa1/YidC/SpoIIIJ
MHLLYPFVQNPGQVNTYFLGMNLSNKGNWILAILAAVSQFWQSKMIMPKMQPGAQGMQSMLTNQMIYFMPLITLVFALQFPAGLALYWVTTTVFAVATQWFVLKDSKKENFGEEANKSKSEGRITKFLKKYSEVQKNGRKGK